MNTTYKSTLESCLSKLMTPINDAHFGQALYVLAETLAMIPSEHCSDALRDIVEYLDEQSAVVGETLHESKGGVQICSGAAANAYVLAQVFRTEYLGLTPSEIITRLFRLSEKAFRPKYKSFAPGAVTDNCVRAVTDYLEMSYRYETIILNSGTHVFILPSLDYDYQHVSYTDSVSLPKVSAVTIIPNNEYHGCPDYCILESAASVIVDAQFRPHDKELRAEAVDILKTYCESDDDIPDWLYVQLLAAGLAHNSQYEDCVIGVGEIPCERNVRAAFHRLVCDVIAR